MSGIFDHVASLPVGSVGAALVERFEVTESAARSSKPGEYVNPGVYVRLIVGGTMYMSNTKMEKVWLYDPVERMHGRVLIGGLGLGMILPPLLKKDSVASVHVLERYQDVIDLVGPRYAHPKLTIECADAFAWRPPKDVRYESIFYDIWPDLSTGNLGDIRRLHARAKFWLNRADAAPYLDSWAADYLRGVRRRGGAY